MLWGRKKGPPLTAVPRKHETANPKSIAVAEDYRQCNKKGIKCLNQSGRYLGHLQFKISFFFWYISGELARMLYHFFGAKVVSRSKLLFTGSYASASLRNKAVPIIRANAPEL